ncbi:MAG: ParB/RepB/Spo0J family partition protein [Spirochaetales bacterium]|nr:MAG: ParB/RepB/Spo0J family partition protein [Spirochaetales bacterium]
MAKAGLGRGLGALLPESAFEETDAGNREPGSEGVRSVPLGRITPSPDQPRKRFDDESLGELADSIRRHGVIQPLIVESTDDGSYRIVAGERRWRAAALAGLKDIPVIVRELGLEKRLEVALVENVQREDLNPVDEAEAYRQLMEMTGLTQDQVAERVGKSRPAVANSLRLLNLPSAAMEAVRSGMASAGHARAILSIVNPMHRDLLLRRVLKEGISVREAEAAAADLNKGIKSGAKPAERKSPPRLLDPDLAILEQDLIGRLGTKVAIKGNSQKGTIVIDYFSMNDLERLYSLMTGNAD